MKKLFRNRIFLGVICLIFALIICFVVSPLFNSAAQARTEIVRIEKPVLKGAQFNAEDVTTITVGAYNLPPDVITLPSEIIGKYAAADFSKGDYVLKSKIADTPNKKNEYVKTINEQNAVISFTIKSFANGVSSNLRPNDVISLIASSVDKAQASYVPEALKYVKVLAISCEDGTDYDILAPRADDTAPPVAATITVLATPSQAQLIAELENNAIIHVALISRDNDAKQAELLQIQADIVKLLDEEKAAEEALEGQEDVLPKDEDVLPKNEEETNG